MNNNYTEPVIPINTSSKTGSLPETDSNNRNDQTKIEKEKKQVQSDIHRTEKRAGNKKLT